MATAGGGSVADPRSRSLLRLVSFCVLLAGEASSARELCCVRGTSRIGRPATAAVPPLVPPAPVPAPSKSSFSFVPATEVPPFAWTWLEGPFSPATQGLPISSPGPPLDFQPDPPTAPAARFARGPRPRPLVRTGVGQLGSVPARTLSAERGAVRRAQCGPARPRLRGFRRKPASLCFASVCPVSEVRRSGRWALLTAETVQPGFKELEAFTVHRNVRLRTSLSCCRSF